MLYWAFVFLVVAVVAGALGFRGLSAAAATVAKVLFGIFLALFLLFLLLALGIGSASQLSASSRAVLISKSGISYPGYPRVMGTGWTLQRRVDK